MTDTDSGLAMTASSHWFLICHLNIVSSTEYAQKDGANGVNDVALAPFCGGKVARRCTMIGGQQVHFYPACLASFTTYFSDPCLNITMSMLMEVQS